MTTTASTTDARQTVTVALRDRLLFEHNAQFNGGRTFRFVPPIPIHFVTPDVSLNDFFTTQFVAWEVALAGAGGAPMYELRPMASASVVPARGIFFYQTDLPDSPDGTVIVGAADPFSPLAQSRQSPLIRRLRQHVMSSNPRRLEIPEIQANGAIQRCQILLDLDAILNDLQLASTVRHEIGHCLGFLGHVSNPQGLMHATSCCPLAITPDVSGMMRRLYSLPPGTPVTP